MNWLDITIACILLLSALAGARKGFSREIIGLSAALLGLLLATQFYRMAGEPLRPYIGQENLSSAGGFFLVFFGVIIVGAIVSSIVRRLLNAVGLSSIDRLLGAIYGTVRGGLIAMVLIFALGVFTTSPAVVQSRMAPYLIEASHLAAKVAPQNLKARIQRQYQQTESK